MKPNRSIFQEIIAITRYALIIHSLKLTTINAFYAAVASEFAMNWLAQMLWALSTGVLKHT
jgi:hypothetical protein